MSRGCAASSLLSSHLAKQSAVVLDLLVWTSDQPHHVLLLLTGPVVHGVHVSRRDGRQDDAGQVPVVPLHAILVHPVHPPREAALSKFWNLDAHRGATSQLQGSAHGHRRKRQRTKTSSAQKTTG